MINKILLTFGAVFLISGSAFSQWEKRDSVWLENVLSGKEQIKLSPEAMKAIKNGTLINTSPASGMKMVTPDVKSNMIVDFSEYIYHDSIRRNVPIEELPTGVTWAYSADDMGAKKVLEAKGFDISAPEGQSNTTLSGTVVARVDVGAMTSRKEYVHNRNAKRDETWKKYNDLPTPDVKRKRDQFASQMRAKAVRDSLALNNPDSLKFSVDTLRFSSMGPERPLVF